MVTQKVEIKYNSTNSIVVFQMNNINTNTNINTNETFLREDFYKQQKPYFNSKAKEEEAEEELQKIISSFSSNSISPSSLFNFSMKPMSNFLLPPVSNLFGSLLKNQLTDLQDKPFVVNSSTSCNSSIQFNLNDDSKAISQALKLSYIINSSEDGLKEKEKEKEEKVDDFLTPHKESKTEMNENKDSKGRTKKPTLDKKMQEQLFVFMKTEELENKKKSIYTCPYCEDGKSFKRGEHLKRHIMIHTGEEPFVCSIKGCSKKFNRSDNLTQHLKSHIRRNELDSGAVLQRKSKNKNKNKS